MKGSDFVKKGMKNWLISAGICGGLFLLLVVLLLTVDVGYAVPHAPVGLSTINGFVFETIGENPEWEKVSDWLFGMVIVCLLVMIVMANSKRFGCKRVSIFSIHYWEERNRLNDFYFVFYSLVVMVFCYAIFELFVINYRPIVEYGGEIEASFPSTHTLISVGVFGVFAVWLAYRLPKAFWKYLIIGALCVAALVSSLARLMMGVHWLTDVLGGLLLGGTIVCLCGAGFSYLRAKEQDE